MNCPVIPLPEPRAIGGFPVFEPDVFKTEKGACYFKESGVAMISRPDSNLEPTSEFLRSFDDDLGFDDYLCDATPIDGGSKLAKFAGQLCYLSFGEKRTWNKDAGRYFDHIKELGHGSILEHAHYAFLFWGIDRATTHELVRHRHLGFSQVSQRYCDGKALRFVERPEYQPERLPADAAEDAIWSTEELHDGFVDGIDIYTDHYNAVARDLKTARDNGHPSLQGGSPTEVRKHLNQVARECLPNSTEAPIVVSGNARAWRGFIDQRANPSADIPIRELAIKVLKCLQFVSPLIFGDYVVEVGEAGYEIASTKWRKV